jgi:ferric-dicitrate binding protein FerR (iron transport regulator)
VVTKKQRRTQLARARAQRRTESRARRESRRRLVQSAAVLVAVLAALGALIFWIVTHDDDRSASLASVVDYDALPAVQSTTPIEVFR